MSAPGSSKSVSVKGYRFNSEGRKVEDVTMYLNVHNGGLFLSIEGEKVEKYYRLERKAFQEVQAYLTEEKS